MCRKTRDNTGPTSHIQHMLARVKRHSLNKIRGPWDKKCRDQVALIGFWRTAANLPLLVWMHLLAALVEHGLLDHAVCPQQDGLRDRQTQRLGGLEVDHQLEFGCSLDRAALAPFRIRSTRTIDRRQTSGNRSRRPSSRRRRPPP